MAIVGVKGLTVAKLNTVRKVVKDALS